MISQLCGDFFELKWRISSPICGIEEKMRRFVGVDSGFLREDGVQGVQS